MNSSMEEFNSREPTEEEKEIAEAMIEALSDDDFEFFNDLAGRVVEEPSMAEEIKSSAKHGDMDSAYDFATSTPEDMEGGLDRAKDVLNDLNTHFEDEGKSFYTNTEKGSPSAIFYRLLDEEFPDLGFRVSEDAVTMDGDPLKNSIRVETDPYGSKRSEVARLVRQNPKAKVLVLGVVTPNNRKLARKLEERGDLPENFTERLKVKECKRKVEYWKNQGRDMLAKDYKRKLGGLTAEPFSDEDLREFMREVINEEIISGGSWS